MISVKAFGELEFWAALIKVVALTTFLVVGIVFLVGRFKVEGTDHRARACGPTTAGSSRPAYCRWCWSPQG